jgi:hypothetical protein
MSIAQPSCRVALAPGYSLDMRRIGQDLLEAPFQHVPDRLPVDAGRLHRHMRASGLLQPIRKLNQPPRGRRKPAHLIGRLPRMTSRRQATTSFLCTSRPAHLLCNVFIRAVGVRPLLKMNSIHRPLGQVPSHKLDARRGNNNGCSKGLIKLSHGLDSTNAEPTSMPTAP